MNKLHNAMGMMMEESMYNLICENIKKQEEEWIEEYSKMNKVQRFVTNSKLNIEIMKDKNMSLKQKLSLVVLGA